MFLVGCGSGGESNTIDAPTGDADAGSNLLRNSDFEQVDGSNWLVDWANRDSNPDGQIVVVSDQKHAGSRAVQWQMDLAGDGREYWITQQGLTPQQLQPGKRYALVGWYHVDQPGEVALNYIVRGQPGDTPDLSTVPDVPVYPKVVGSWAEFRYELTIPADAAPQSYEVSLHSIKFNQAATKLTLDQVRLFAL